MIKFAIAIDEDGEVTGIYTDSNEEILVAVCTANLFVDNKIWAPVISQADIDYVFKNLVQTGETNEQI